MSQKPNTALYDLLDVLPNASPQEIKKAYRLLAIKLHPDKNPTDTENAQKNFQKLQEAYEILKDENKRAIYDRTGETGEDISSFFEAYEYYRTFFKRVEVQDIEEFSLTYFGSDAEKEDLVEFYMDFNGDLTQLLNYIPLSDESQIPRYLAIFDGLIESEEIPKTKAFSRTRDTIQPESEKSENIENVSFNKPQAISNDLIAAIRGNNLKRGSFVDELEVKYSTGKKPKTGKKAKKSKSKRK